MSLFELHAQIEFPTHYVPVSQSLLCMYLLFPLPKNGYGTPGECQNELYGHSIAELQEKGLMKILTDGDAAWLILFRLSHNVQFFLFWNRVIFVKLYIL